MSAPDIRFLLIAHQEILLQGGYKLGGASIGPSFFNREVATFDVIAHSAVEDVQELEIAPVSLESSCQSHLCQIKVISSETNLFNG